jgi:epoxyqueuosine reductase
MVDRVRLTGGLKAEARRLGFDLVGITTPDPPPHVDVFRAWIAQGRHASMAYLATERSVARRTDPASILPGCRSILVVGQRYLPPPPAASPRLAAYAQGPDYHDWIVPRLEELMAWLRSASNAAFDHRVYTDTGPILERDLAQRAGLGWIGKNTCLIHPGDGSYFLLGEALTTLDLVPDEPFTADRCGTCTRCIEACPTECILPDRTLDSARCISYLTIEHRGPIPPDLRPSIGPWLFGCDICQEVCPWNLRFAQGGAQPDPHAVQAAAPSAFLDPTHPPNLKGTALARARKSGMARNAAVVLGNARGADGIPALAAALREHPEALVRSHAAWALGNLGTAECTDELQAALRTERDGRVRAEIQRALGRSPGRAGQAEG